MAKRSSCLLIGWTGWVYCRILLQRVISMKDFYILLISNRDCSRSLLYLCNQAMINYDAELKKIIHGEKVTKVSLCVASGDPTFSSQIRQRHRTRKTTGETSTSNFPARKQPGCSVCSMLILPFILFSWFFLSFLLHKPSGSVADSQGLSMDS